MGTKYIFKFKKYVANIFKKIFNKRKRKMERIYK